MEIEVWGASDDLIEFRGDIKEETTAFYDEPTYIAFSNGLILKAEYTKRGVWEIDVLNLPDSSSATIQEKGEANKARNSYSEVAVIETEEEVNWCLKTEDMKQF